MLSRKNLPEFAVNWRNILLLIFVCCISNGLLLYLFYDVFSEQAADNFAVDSQDNIYVAEFGSGKIGKYDPTGQFLESFSRLQKDGTSNYSTSRFFLFTFDAENNFYTISNLSNLLIKYDQRGNLLQQITLPDRAQNLPKQLVVDRAGNIYVLFSPGTQPVLRMYRPDGTEVANFAARLGGLKQSTNLVNLAVDTRGYLFLSDRKGQEIYVLAPESSRLMPMQLNGDYLPQSFRQMVVDSQGNFYMLSIVGDIIKYSREGQQTKLWISPVDMRFLLMTFNPANNSIYGLSNSNGQILVQKFDTNLSLVDNWTVGVPTIRQLEIFLLEYSLLLLLFVLLPSLVTRRTGLANLQSEGRALSNRLRQLLNSPSVMFDNLNLKQSKRGSFDYWLDGILIILGITVILVISLILPFKFLEVIPISWHDDSKLVVIILALLLAGVLVAGAVAWNKWLNYSLSKRYGGILQEVLSNFPASYPKRFAGEQHVIEKIRYRNYLILVSLCTIICIGGLLVFNHNLQIWLMEIIVVGGCGLAWILALVIGNYLPAKDNEVKLGWSELFDLIWRIGLLFLLFCIANSIFSSFYESLETSYDRTAYLDAMQVISLLLVKYIIFLGILWRILIYWIYSSHYQAYYKVAILKAKYIQQWRPIFLYPYFQYSIEVSAGALTEAEYTIFSALAGSIYWKPPQLAVLVEGLAILRRTQQRYPEAIYFFEKTLELDSSRISAYAGVGGVYLRMESYSNRAVELLDYAVSRATNLRKQLLPASKIEMLASRAWALAQAGRIDEAELVLQMALTKVSRKSRPLLALIYLRAAKVKELQNQPTLAREYYHMTVRADAHGLAGQTASTILGERGWNE